MKGTWRMIMLTVLASLLCVGAAALVTMRAAAQGDVRQPPPPAEGQAIPEDPTAVPDAEESADNNVTFPVDI